MANFLARRFFSSIISVIGATMAIFILIQFHSDPRELFVPDSGWGITQEQWDRLGERLGLNEPLWKQYVTWIGRTLRGDLGISLARDRPVTDLIKGKIGATVQLAVGGWIFAVLLGIPLGVLAAVKRGTFWDYFGRSVAIVGQAAPPFVTALVAIWIFAVVLGWFPAGGRSPDFNWKEYVLPCVALGWGAAASLMRLTRSSMLEVLDSEYIKLARAKGVSERSVIWKHALRNAIIQPLTIATLLLAGFMDGAVLVEVIFAWPGVGRVAVEAVNSNDFMLITGTVFIFTALYLFMSLVADLLYTVVDPRIRYA